uniref:Uncharacterized protein n=1 Tax=Periophthalmus magnuspinnatus TaxID=409849 RepID=A0A3B4BDX7_9GOBI
MNIILLHLRVFLCIGGCKKFTKYELSKEELTELFNSPVYYAEWMVRPLWKLPIVIGPISHSGVRVTLCDGSMWLIHKVPKNGTVVTSATYMLDRWSDFNGEKTVSDLVNSGGKSYNLIFNCHVASIKMMVQ